MQSIVIEGGREMKCICIAGKNDIAVDVLQYILDMQLDVELGVICNKGDKGINSWQKSLRFFARQNNIKEYTLSEIYNRKELLFLSLEFDQIIHPEYFADARLFNIHFSLLPAYKGMYTSAWPILRCEEVVGVTFHRIDAGIDTGEIISQKSFLVGNKTCRELYLCYIRYGTDLVINALEKVISNRETSYPQSSTGSSYFSKRSIDYSNITVDLNQTADYIDRQVRAFNFREYQMPVIYEHRIISTYITDNRSVQKPGTIIDENASAMLVATIDYNIVLFYDRFDELMKACETGDMIKVHDICTVKEHINCQNERGWSPLIVATYHNYVDIVKYLIMLGADIRVTNYNGTNLLMYAKEAYKGSGDNTLFILYRKLGLKESYRDMYGHDLLYYINKEKIELEDLLKEE